MKNKGKLLVISGPSGVGKGTLCRLLMENNKNITFSVSATTRNPRNEDKEGVTYFFKTKDEFKKMIDDGKFLEWAVYNDNFYGTPIDAVNEKLDKGYDVLLEIEAQGAINVMQRCPESISIFIVPPDVDTLYKRLRGRGTEDDFEIEKRVKAAEWELEQKDKYSHIVVNDQIDKALAAIENIIKSEKEKN